MGQNSWGRIHGQTHGEEPMGQSQGQADGQHSHAEKQDVLQCLCSNRAGALVPHHPPPNDHHPSSPFLSFFPLSSPYPPIQVGTSRSSLRGSSLRVSVSSSLASAAVLAAAAAAAASASAAAAAQPTTAGTALASFGLSGSAVADAASAGMGMGGGTGSGGGGGARQSAPVVWREALEMLRRETIETPVLVWNDAKRHELHLVRGGRRVMETPSWSRGERVRGGGDSSAPC